MLNVDEHDLVIGWARFVNSSITIPRIFVEI